MKAKREAKTHSRNSAQVASGSGELRLAASNEPPCREQLIAEAAYFRAERRGFEPGNEISDWLDAEAEVAGRLES